MSQFPPSPSMPPPQPGPYGPPPGAMPPGVAPPPGPYGGWQPGQGSMPPGPAPKKSNTAVIAIVVVLVLVAVGVGAFFVLSSDDPGDPAAVVGDFFEASQSGDCDRMMGMISTATIQAAGSTPQEVTQECQDAQVDLQEGLSAGIFGGSDAELVSTEVTSQEGSNAAVTATVRRGEDETTTDLTLVEEDGDWKIDWASLVAGDVPAPPAGDEPAAPPDSTTDTSTGGSGGSDGGQTTTSMTTPDTGGGSTPTTGPGLHGESQAELDAWRDACAGGSMADCDELYRNTRVGTELETFAKTCGGLDPTASHFGTCEAEYG